ncbi:DUF4296 domain-containing protein [Neolewinella sp.]|uniref:DUF4296 domain-containing protein n=1 Tax=Neolewinella sp. TaxID=2993543 RepID=UPI003B5293D8
MTLRLPATLLLLLGLAAGCASLDPGPPPVDAETLAELIADLQLGQSLVNEIPIVVRDSMQRVYYESILADHGYTRQSFDSVMWLVRQEPVWIDTVYARAGEIIAREMVEE